MKCFSRKLHFTCILLKSMFCIVDYPTMDLPQWTVEMDHTAGTVLWIIFALHLQMVSPCLEFTQRKIFNMFKKKYLRHGYSVSLKFTQWWLPFLESPKQSIIQREKIWGMNIWSVLNLPPDNEGEKTKANVFCIPQYDN